MLGALVIASTAFAQEPTPIQTTWTVKHHGEVRAESDTKPTKLSDVGIPNTKNVRKKFTPDCCPSSARGHWILAQERKRWGGPYLGNRVQCESTWNYRATNGQYRGYLQIGPWWNYAYPRTPRDVKVRSTDRRGFGLYRTRTYPDGTVEKVRKPPLYQRVNKTLVGTLPKGASPYHGWAALRVGQRAVSGSGPSTGWSCGL